MAMRARLGRLWDGSQVRSESSESKGRSGVASKSSPIKLVVALFVALLVLVFFISNSTTVNWSEQGVDSQSLKTKGEQGVDPQSLNKQNEQGVDPKSLNKQDEQGVDPQSLNSQPSKAQSVHITLSCPNQNAAVCQRSTLASALSLTTSQHSATCPEYFRWIHEDLRHWKSTGITKETVESAKKFATFRLVVLDGRVYVEEYFGHLMARNVFTLWGILQLVNRYPGRVPDLDLMFNCMDQPAIKSAEYKSSTLPPVFHYCNNDQTSDILFPDWSFWGWPETNIKPWVPLMKEMKEANEEIKWTDREPYAFWKGNPLMGRNRHELLKCNMTNEQDWNARIYTQDWKQEEKQGFQHSNLARQCSHRQVLMDRYRIYVDGLAWSVSQKYIMACNSPTLFVNTPWYEFFQRGLIPRRHYWPIPENNLCRAIKLAVDWGNEHQQEAQTMGKASSDFFQEEVKMDFVYDYMLHVLTEYAKLLRYKPTIPEKATEFCLESMACPAPGNVKKFLLDSMEKSTHDAEPCKLPPPFTPEELQQLLENKANAVKQVEMWGAPHLCVQEAYMVPPDPKAARVPPEQLDSLIVFHDGRLVQRPDPPKHVGGRSSSSFFPASEANHSHLSSRPFPHRRNRNFCSSSFFPSFLLLLFVDAVDFFFGLGTFYLDLLRGTWFGISAHCLRARIGSEWRWELWSPAEDSPPL
ncbi:unnamed protein product [Musa banksii]